MPDLDVVILNHDNAPAHNTELDNNLLGFSLLSYLSYSAALAPFDFHLCPDLQKELKGQRF